MSPTVKIDLRDDWTGGISEKAAWGEILYSKSRDRFKTKIRGYTKCQAACADIESLMRKMLLEISDDLKLRVK